MATFDTKSGYAADSPKGFRLFVIKRPQSVCPSQNIICYSQSIPSKKKKSFLGGKMHEALFRSSSEGLVKFGGDLCTLSDPFYFVLIPPDLLVRKFHNRTFCTLLFTQLCSWEQTSLSKMFVEAGLVPKHWILYNAGQWRMISIADFNHLEGWPDIFGKMVKENLHGRMVDLLGPISGVIFSCW